MLDLIIGLKPVYLTLALFIVEPTHVNIFGYTASIKVLLLLSLERNIDICPRISRLCIMLIEMYYVCCNVFIFFMCMLFIYPSLLMLM